MESTVNFFKSIAKKRLLYKDIGTICDYIVTYAVSVMFILLGLMLLFKCSVMPVAIIILNILFIIWMLANVILFNKLIKIKGKEIGYNRKVIVKIINEHFNLDIEDRDQNVIRSEKISDLFSGLFWGRIISLLFDDDQIYLNIQRLGRWDMISIFHGLASYLKAKRIKKIFEQRLNLHEI